MKRILTAIIAILVMGTGLSAQNMSNDKKTKPKETRTELVNYLASLPGVSVTYLTDSMLKRVNKDGSTSPLAALVSGSGTGVESVRVFELGSAKAEEGGKKLLNSYISESPNAELFVLQRDGSSETMIYGIPARNLASGYFRYLLMYSKESGEKAKLIIISGAIWQKSIGNMIDAFSK